MTFNPETALTDLDTAVKTICANLTQIAEVKDVATATTYRDQLHHTLSRAISTYKQVTLPARWQRYCGYCGFQRAPNEAGRSQCPDCGEGLRTRNVDTGQDMRRRPIMTIA